MTITRVVIIIILKLSHWNSAGRDSSTIGKLGTILSPGHMQAYIIIILGSTIVYYISHIGIYSVESEYWYMNCDNTPQADTKNDTSRLLIKDTDSQTGLEYMTEGKIDGRD